MASWLGDYITTLEYRDSDEKANEDLYRAYAKLADHVATLHKQSAANAAIQPPTPDITSSPTPSRATGKSPKQPSSTPSPQSANADELTRLRFDLATSHRLTSTLQAQVRTLTLERDGLLSTTSALAQRERELRGLERKLRDRDEELKGKARLVETVQDEMVGLEMQVNVAEEKIQRLERENKELVDRWMRRMGKEADDMNRQGGWAE